VSAFSRQFYSVGDRVVDTLLVYALSDLAKKADKRVTFEWTLGRDVIFTLHSDYPDMDRRMLVILTECYKSITLANRLNFLINIGGGKGKRWTVNPIACLYCQGKEGKNPCDRNGNCGAVSIPAYSVLFKNLNEVGTVEWGKDKVLTKNKRKDYKTLYIGLSPYWSKGTRQWNSQWDSGPSTYLPPQVQVLIFYGLAHYSIVSFADTLIELIFSPPFGKFIGYKEAKRILELIKRIVNKFSVRIRRMSINQLPSKTLPVVLLSLLDLQSIFDLTREHISLLFVSYDIDRAVPKNPRGHEELMLVDIGDFYTRLREHFWEFKCMIEDLAISARRDEFRTRAQSILLDFSYAIFTRNYWLLNDAVFKAKKLSDEGIYIHLPSRDSILQAQQILAASFT